MQTTQTFLLEDALELWSAVVVQAMSPDLSDIMSLAPYLFHVFGLGTSSLILALRIAESYILLAPSYMLNDEMRQNLLISITSLVVSAKIEPIRAITQIMEILIRSTEALGGEKAIQILINDMIQTNLLVNILKGIHGSWESHQTTGPRRKSSPIDRIIELDYFIILARLVLANPFIFQTSINAVMHLVAVDVVTSDHGEKQDRTIEWLLEEWFESFDSIAEPTTRKLMCLALTNFLGSGSPWILNKLQDLMTVWTDVISELTEGTDEKFEE